MIAPQAVAKVVKLIPMLGSDHDGEVVASAWAIGRSLKSSGRDWHDLAAAAETMAKPGARPKPVGQPWRRVDEPAPLWGELSAPGRKAWLRAMHRSCWLSTWEADFIADICARDPVDIGRLTPKQIICLNRIIARAFSMGVRP
jgi:hypothetical protein